jgi:hypothetical protein
MEHPGKDIYLFGREIENFGRCGKCRAVAVQARAIIRCGFKVCQYLTFGSDVQLDSIIVFV